MFRAKAGPQTFERFEWCAIRWMQIVIRDAPEGLRIRGLGAVATHYPVDDVGKFTCSDLALTQLWSTGAYTLKMCMHDGWIDCPGREQRQWLGDVTVENLAAHMAFGPGVAALTAKYLLQAAESQRPDGLTQMFAPGDHGVDGMLIPDWTLQWILCAEDHLQLTNDSETIQTIFPSVLKALDWFDRQRGPSGLVADLPYWHFIDWAGVGREGEAATLNAQYGGALLAAAKMADAVMWPVKATNLRMRAAAIFRALAQRHWDKRRGIYVDMVDPRSGTQAPRVSQHANASVALWGEECTSRISRMLDRITDSERLTFTAAPGIVPTGDTLDPENGVVLANTFYSHFVYEALSRHGRLRDALELMRARFGPMLSAGATTLWESYGPTASLCHGFSASPTWVLSSRVLGVRATTPGFETADFAPDLADLDFASGVVPTTRGEVEVRLERTKDGFVGTASSPFAGLAVGQAPGAELISASAIKGRIEARYRQSHATGDEAR